MPAIRESAPHQYNVFKSRDGNIFSASENLNLNETKNNAFNLNVSVFSDGGRLNSGSYLIN